MGTHKWVNLKTSVLCFGVDESKFESVEKLTVSVGL